MSTADLAKNECVPCKGGMPKLSGGKLSELFAELGNDWQLIESHHLEKEYSFKNFADALTFTNKVGAIAEEQNHHPDILTCWGKTTVTIWTHKIDGLTESDFYFAAKCDMALGA